METCIGPFRILREIGRGQNATVFEAHDTRRDEAVALKVLHVRTGDAEEDGSAGAVGPARPQDEATLLRFVREAEAIRRLSHPNIVRIRDAGTDNGNLYIAMERLRGETLRARLARGPLPTEEARQLGLQLASALAFAHDRGIMHRDVKPDNIFLLPDGTAKLMDFGAARLQGEHSLTRTGSVIGSPAYMAPEQVCGEPPDGRTDVWGLAATLFEVVTGAKPFPGESVAAVMYGILHKRPAFAAVPDPDFAAVLEKAMAKKMSARPAGAAAFAEDLRRLASDRPVQSASGRPRPTSRSAVLLGVSAAAALLLAGLLALPRVAARDPRRAPPSVLLPGVAAPLIAPPTALVSAPPRRPDGAAILVEETRPPAPAPAAPTAKPAPRLSSAPVVAVPASHPPRLSQATRETAAPAIPAVPKKTPGAPKATQRSAAPTKTQQAAAPAPTTTQAPKPDTPPPVVLPAPPEETAPAPAPKVEPPLLRRARLPQTLGQRNHGAESQIHPAPRLPATLSGFRGEVHLRVGVDTDGVVQSVEVLRSSGDERADLAAMRVVRRRWEYAPAVRNGRPIPDVVEEIIVFGGDDAPDIGLE